MTAKIQRLLIVDDDEGDRLIAERVLEKAGACVRIAVAEDGLAALSRLGLEAPPPGQLDWQPDVILLDINMPRLGGFAFLDRICGAGAASNTAVVMLTSSLNEQDRERARAYSIVKGYEEKPLTQEAALALAARFGT